MLKVQTLIVTKSLSMKFLSSKCKKLWTKERIETFWVNNSQIKARIEPQEAGSSFMDFTYPELSEITSRLQFLV